MKHALRNRLFVSLAVGLCIIVFNRIGFAGDSGVIQQKENLKVENRETESKQKYSYRYYPSCSVYYDIHRKLYFYREDDNWKVFASLPGNLRRKIGDPVEIEMNNDKPYIDIDEHIKKFPPEDSKKTKKNLWSKLIFVLLYKYQPK